MGAAAHRSGGQVGFVLSAATAAVGLYGTVVAFGLGPTFPLALGPESDGRPSIVRVAHDSAVSGPVKRGPQPSTGPERRRSVSPPRRSSYVSSKTTAEKPSPQTAPAAEASPPPPNTVTPNTVKPSAEPSPVPPATDPLPVVPPSATLPAPLPSAPVPVPVVPLPVELPELPALALGG